MRCDMGGALPGAIFQNCLPQGIPMKSTYVITLTSHNFIHKSDNVYLMVDHHRVFLMCSCLTSHNISQHLTTSHNISQHLTTSHNISQLKQIPIYLEASWNHLTVRRKHLGCDWCDSLPDLRRLLVREVTSWSWQPTNGASQARSPVTPSMARRVTGPGPYGISKGICSQISIIFPSYFHHISIIFSSYFHHISIIFPSYSHHISIIFPSYSHHISIIFPSYSHHIPIIFPSYFHHIPIIFPSYFHHIPIIFPSFYMDLMGIWWEYSGIYLEVMGRSYGESPFINTCAIFHSKLLNNQRLDAVGNLENQYWIIYTTMILIRFTYYTLWL